MSLIQKNPRLVVLGAGYAGLPCAVELGKRASERGGRSFQVTLINREPRQELVCELYRTLRNGKAALYPFVKPLRRHGVNFLEGSVHSIDPRNRVLQVRGDRAQTVPYDELIVAAGYKAKLPEIEGLKGFLDGPPSVDKRVFLFRNNTQVQSLRLALRRIGWGPERQRADRDLFCVIIGAGSTGLEVAGELAAFRGRNSACRVIVVDHKNEILPRFPMLARNLYNRELRRGKVETILGSPAVRVTESELHIANGQVIPWDLLILCTGGRPASVLSSFESSLVEKGLAARGDLGIEGWENHHVIGDLAVSASHDWPKTAQSAWQAGEFVARKLALKIREGRRSSDVFDPTDLGYLVSFGPYGGVGRIGPPARGALAKLTSPFLFGPPIDELKRAAKFRYLWSVR